MDFVCKPSFADLSLQALLADLSLQTTLLNLTCQTLSWFAWPFSLKQAGNPSMIVRRSEWSRAPQTTAANEYRERALRTSTANEHQEWAPRTSTENLANGAMLDGVRALKHCKTLCSYKINEWQKTINHQANCTPKRQAADRECIKFVFLLTSSPVRCDKQSSVLNSPVFLLFALRVYIKSIKSILATGEFTAFSDPKRLRLTSRSWTPHSISYRNAQESVAFEVFDEYRSMNAVWWMPFNGYH